MNDTLLDQSNTVQTDPNKNYLEELVGEGKKFKTPEDLARGKYEADQMISHKNQQFDQLREDYLKLREEYTSRAKLEDLVDQLAQRQLASSESNTQNTNEASKPSIDPKEIESLVSSKIQEFELSKKQTENFNQVRSRLSERYGNNYQSVLKEQIEQLGLTEMFVNDLARNHPQVLYKTLGLDQPKSSEQFQAPPRSQRNDSFAPSTQKRTWSYYQKMRKENPKLWLDNKTQTQMLKDRVELGDAFEDGSWHVR